MLVDVKIDRGMLVDSKAGMLVDAKTESSMLEDSKAGMHVDVDVLEGNNQ